MVTLQDGRVKAGREAELSSGQNRSAEPVRWQQVVTVMKVVVVVVVEVMVCGGRRRSFRGHHGPH